LGDKEKEVVGAEKPHFDISSYVVKQLGDELISDEVTALMELVKNSYDADADYANIVIDTHGTLTEYDINYKSHRGYITIDDNGDGMTRNEIENGWLTISLSKKRAMKASGQATTKGRTPLGEKGLGRLSTQRLASKIEILTNTEQEQEEFASHVYFNWSDFREDTLLSQVNVEIQNVNKDSVKKGTRLILLDLKDPNVWLGDNAVKIKGKLSQLIFPKKRRRPFTVYLTINGQSVDLDFISDRIKDLAVTRYAFTFYHQTLTLLGRINLAKLKGNDRANYVHLIEADNGKAFYDFITNRENKKGYIYSKLDFIGEKGVFIEFKKSILLNELSELLWEKKGESEKELIDPGHFRGKIDEYTFAKDAGDAASLQDIFKEFSQFTKYIQTQTGIRVFRDGFGIRPFGLDGEDWLKLSQEQTSGSSFYGIRPGNVIGYIQIGAQSNPQLLEKTDREGLIDNGYYKNFLAINKRVIAEVNSLLEEIRRAYNEFRKKYGIDRTGLKDQDDVFDLMKKTGQEAKALVDQVKQLESGVTTTYNSVKNEVRKISKENLFTTEEDNRLQPLLRAVEDQLEQAKNILSKLNVLLADSVNLNEAVHLIEPQIKALQDQLAEFSELAGLGIVAETLSHEIDNVLDNLAQKSKVVTKHLKSQKLKDPVLYSYVEYVNNITTSLRKQASHLSPLLKYMREEKNQISLQTFVNELGDFYTERFKKNNITLEILVEKDFTISINKGRLTQVFDNIILNSEYWLVNSLAKPIPNRKITVNITKPVVKIFDNGYGIDPSIEDKVFQPFVTRKPKKAGRGLGLFIVQQLLESCGSDIVLLSEKNQNERRYIFQINFSTIIK
jgi:signal transduction histidine kinase